MNKIRWTSEEDKVLIEFFENSTKGLILSKFPNRDWKSIYSRTKLLGLSREREGGWTEAENNLLREIYPSNTHEFIVSKFPNKTWKAISWHACMMLGIVRDERATQKETKKTNMINIGSHYPTQSASIRAKIVETLRERYGVDNIFQLKKLHKKVIKINSHESESSTKSVTKKQKVKGLKKRLQNNLKEDIFDKLPYPRHTKIDTKSN